MKKLFFVLILNVLFLTFACNVDNDFTPIDTPRSGETSQSVAVACDSLFAIGQPDNGIKTVQVDSTYEGASGECRMSISFYNPLPLVTAYYLELNGNAVSIGTAYDFEVPDEYFVVTARWQYTQLPTTHNYYGVLHSAIRSFDP